MTEEERDQRKAEVIAAREHYEQLRDAYERDVQKLRGAGMMAGDLIMGTPRERQAHERAFRNGYLHGAREALGYLGGRVGPTLEQWLDGDLVEWFKAYKRDKGAATPPPQPGSKRS